MAARTAVAMNVLEVADQKQDFKLVFLESTRRCYASTRCSLVSHGSRPRPRPAAVDVDSTFATLPLLDRQYNQFKTIHIFGMRRTTQFAPAEHFYSDDKPIWIKIPTTKRVHATATACFFVVAAITNKATP